jgi:hypothetical protein
MKAMPYLLAISLVANLVLGWMLWQQHPAPVNDPAVAQSEPLPSSTQEDEALPLPVTSSPLVPSPLLPFTEAGALTPDDSVLPDPRASLVPPADQPYAPPPPPNPHAFPAWRERTPYRETQFHRALLSNPR